MEDDSTSSVYRSVADNRVWMCNIPATDVETGISSATSLRTIKIYVEQISRRFGLTGEWVKISPDHWQYQIG